MYTPGMRGEVETAARPHGRVYACLALTMFFWGSAFPTSKMLVFEVRPEVAAVLRFGIGSLMLCGVWLVNRPGRALLEVARSFSAR